MPAANCDSEIGLKGIPLVFHVAETEAERRFAFEQFVRYAKGEKPAVWHAAVEKNQVILAEADLNNDGVPERFVMARISLWCGSAGCLTLILQEKRGKWQLIDQGRSLTRVRWC